jgi:hypothetical protein
MCAAGRGARTLAPEGSARAGQRRADHVTSAGACGVAAQGALMLSIGRDGARPTGHAWERPDEQAERGAQRQRRQMVEEPCRPKAELGHGRTVGRAGGTSIGAAGVPTAGGGSRVGRTGPGRRPHARLPSVRRRKSTTSRGGSARLGPAPPASGRRPPSAPFPLPSASPARDGELPAAPARVRECDGRRR